MALFGIAAVILFTPLSRSDFAGFAFTQVFAEDNFIETRLVQRGSFAYSSDYQFLAQADDFEEGFGGEEEFSASMLIQGSAFLAPANPHGYLDGIGIFGKSRGDTIAYEVQPGDTPSYIAASFGISTNTLLWANNLDYWSTIRPGQKLVILPVSGVFHEVKKGETLAKIVKDFKGNFDEAIVYNGLPADGAVFVGQKIIIPGGSKPIYYQPKPQYAIRSNAGFTGPYSGKSHKFPWGQCTWYIAQVRYIPWGGHAKSWISNAEQHGFQTGKEPRVGAIVATSETWYGHVAYVEAVNEGFITVSEMSLGRGVKKIRNIPIASRKIKGYIY